MNCGKYQPLRGAANWTDPVVYEQKGMVSLPSLRDRAVVGSPDGEGVRAADSQVDAGHHSDQSCAVIDGEVSLISSQDSVAHQPVETLISIHSCQLKT